MDLNSITSVATPRRRAEMGRFEPGDAWLAGGTWLFSEPQPHLRRLIDLASLGWTALEAGPDGLRIGATCTIAELAACEGRAEWAAWPLVAQCCRALLGSFKIWNVATVGGNVCLALPAAPMISLAAALDGVCLVWTPDGRERAVPVADFVVGAQRTVLRPGEVLRRIDIPAAALTQQAAFRRISLSPLGRSGALLIGTRDGDGGFALIVTAATIRPVRIAWPSVPQEGELRGLLDVAVPMDLFHDDVHGAPDWRHHVTYHFAEEIRRELTG